VTCETHPTREMGVWDPGRNIFHDVRFYAVTVRPIKCGEQGAADDDSHRSTRRINQSINQSINSLITEMSKRTSTCEKHKAVKCI